LIKELVYLETGDHTSVNASTMLAFMSNYIINCTIKSKINVRQKL